MALTQGQQELIEGSISHLLDFATTPSQLEIEITTLKKALLRTTKLKAEHPFYDLVECTLQPQAYLKNLEKLNDPAKCATVSDVQRHILKLITQNLLAAAKVTSKNLVLLWNQEKIGDQIIPQKNNRLKFVTRQVGFDSGEHPWQLTRLPNQIYSQEFGLKYVHIPFESMDLHQEMVFHRAFVKMRIIYEDFVFFETEISIDESVPTEFESDEEENDYIENLKCRAEDEAEEAAINWVVSYWRDKFPEKYYALKEASPTTLVIHKTYFDLVEANKIDCLSLFDMSESAEEHLNDPAVISLIENGFCDFEQAKKLTAAESLLIKHPIYNALLKEKKIHFFDIINIVDSRAQFLICPPIANLIKLGKLSFYQANLLPLELKEALTSSLFINFLSRNNINWHSLYSLMPEECAKLQDPSIAKLVLNESIQFFDLYLLTEKVIQKLKNPLIYDLLFNKSISILDLSLTPAKILTLLDQHAILADSIKTNIINFQDIITTSFTNLCTSIFTRRVQKIYQGELPSSTQNQSDNIKKLAQELKKIIRENNFDQTHFEQNLFRQIVTIIKEDIACRIKNANHEYLVHYKELQTIISNAEQRTHNPWRDTFIALMDCASDILINNIKNNYTLTNSSKRKPEMTVSFFTAQKRKTSNDNAVNLKQLCHRILNLSELTKDNRLTSRFVAF